MTMGAQSVSLMKPNLRESFSTSSCSAWTEASVERATMVDVMIFDFMVGHMVWCAPPRKLWVCQVGEDHFMGSMMNIHGP